MDLQSLQRADRVDGPFRAPRYGRPDPKREPDAYMHWLVTEPEPIRAPGELVKLPWVEEAYTIGPVAAPATDRKWVVVITEPGQERNVCDDLRREDIEPVAPMRTLFRRRRGDNSGQRKISFTTPLLPRYVFAGLGAADDGYRAMHASPRIVDILKRSSGPATVSGDEIRMLLDRETRGEFDETVRRRKGWGKAEPAGPFAWIQIGALVYITKGQFADFNGVIEDVDAGRCRARVGVGAFPVELDFAHFRQWT